MANKLTFFGTPLTFNNKLLTMAEENIQLNFGNVNYYNTLNPDYTRIPWLFPYEPVKITIPVTNNGSYTKNIYYTINCTNAEETAFQFTGQTTQINAGQTINFEYENYFLSGGTWVYGEPFREVIIKLYVNGQYYSTYPQTIYFSCSYAPSFPARKTTNPQGSDIIMANWVRGGGYVMCNYSFPLTNKGGYQPSNQPYIIAKQMINLSKGTVVNFQNFQNAIYPNALAPMSDNPNIIPYQGLCQVNIIGLNTNDFVTFILLCDIKDQSGERTNNYALFGSFIVT